MICFKCNNNYNYYDTLGCFSSHGSQGSQRHWSTGHVVPGLDQFLPEAVFSLLELMHNISFDKINGKHHYFVIVGNGNMSHKI